jgi:hypothetical protein
MSHESLTVSRLEERIREIGRWPKVHHLYTWTKIQADKRVVTRG